MIRDRVKKAAKKIALKAFGMEFDAEARTTIKTKGTKGVYDASKIPKLVDGDGDTPGPNHKEHIGRTYLAAQVMGDEGLTLIDTRPPAEWIVGVMPKALLLPGTQLKKRTEMLPPKDHWIAVYDATMEQNAEELAGWLREQGWSRARVLVGGWAEWVEYDEPQVPCPTLDGAKHLGDPVELVDGRRGTIQALHPGPVYDVLFGEEGSDYVLGIKADGLRP